jgi:hypothetical protein
MNRYRVVGLMLMLAASGVWACGDDDSEPPPSGKELRQLTSSELRGLCEGLLSRVRKASTPEQQCVEVALRKASTTAECESARTLCLGQQQYQDYENAHCRDFSDAKSDDPPFDCDTPVSEVTGCYDRVAKWLTGLRCSQAGKAPAIPSCIDDLNDGRCGIGLTRLLADDGAGDAGSLSCEPGKKVSCLCAGGAKGTQTCNADGVYGVCDCDSDGSGYTCKSGSKSYPYDFVGTAECNACATKSCCPSYVECQSDADCACYWDCLGQSGQDDCLEPCGLTDSPTAFVNHAVCLKDNCRAPCDLQ